MGLSKKIISGIVISIICQSLTAFASGLVCQTKPDNVAIHVTVGTIGSSVLKDIRIQNIDESPTIYKYPAAVYDGSYKPRGPRKLTRFNVMETPSKNSKYSILLPEIQTATVSAVLVEYDGSWGNNYYPIICEVK